MKPNTSFPPLGRNTDWETPSCVCWGDVFRCRDEILYGWVQVRRLSVVNFRHLVLARIETHKKSPKMPGNSFSDALLMSGFQIFAADAAIDWFWKSCRLIHMSALCTRIALLPVRFQNDLKVPRKPIYVTNISITKNRISKSVNCKPRFAVFFWTD